MNNENMLVLATKIDQLMHDKERLEAENTDLKAILANQKKEYRSGVNAGADSIRQLRDTNNALRNDLINTKMNLEIMTKRADDERMENMQWNDSNCSSCPLNSWEACDEICLSRSTMAEYIANLADEIKQLRAKMDLEIMAKCAEILERAIKSDEDNLCHRCKYFGIRKFSSNSILSLEEYCKKGFSYEDRDCNCWEFAQELPWEV